ncbi:MAG TPA: HlyD family efflux transporter periplasmic adaptor subunit [Pseudomonadales bacterium]|nr:HlyD family efflux transporter periplasmic adaptor subunit [Pseudomonadales bacterium]
MAGNEPAAEPTAAVTGQQPATDAVAGGISQEDARSPSVGFLDAGLWQSFGSAREPWQYVDRWLALLIEFVEDVRGAVVVLDGDVMGEPGGGLRPVASWPNADQVDAGLEAISERALAEGRGTAREVHREDADGAQVHQTLAFPLIVDEVTRGVVALEVRCDGGVELRQVMRRVQWSTAWLEVLIRRRTLTGRDRLVAALDLVTTTFEHERFRGGVTAVATELASLLDAERVAIGFRRGDHMRVEGLSHSAEFGAKSNLIGAIEAAMEEAADQQAMLLYPAPPEAAPRVLRAHGELAGLDDGGIVCTVPLADSRELVGGLLLQRVRDRPFTADEIAFLTGLAPLIGPLLELRRREGRWIGRKVAESALDLARRYTGPRNLGLKLGTGLVVLVVVALSLVTGTFRVTADASIEGTIQRAVTSPVAGYISESRARAGDVVASGELLATLDERDFLLEKARWVSERDKHSRGYSRALAEGDRAQVRILGAQIAQADVQLEMLEEQLARTRITAPFDGVIVDGDLTQSLSAPVERGEVLFTVAPLDSYRVILQVDERDIVHVREAQRGELALAALPGEPLPLVVEKITPVSVVEGGENHFRVEARIEGGASILRPGMEGVGKIEIDERRLLWIHTHRLMQWLRLWSWSLWP